MASGNNGDNHSSTVTLLKQVTGVLTKNSPFPFQSTWQRNKNIQYFSVGVRYEKELRTWTSGAAILLVNLMTSIQFHNLFQYGRS